MAGFRPARPTPLRSNNIFAPLFIHVYGEAKTERYRIMAGQAEDLIVPTLLELAQHVSILFSTWQVWFFRPQVRLETYQPIGGGFTLSTYGRGNRTQAIQTFQVAEEVIGDQQACPMVSRIALGYGKLDLRDPYLRRPFELGVSGHIGKGKERGWAFLLPNASLRPGRRGC